MKTAELLCQPEDDLCEPGCESPSMDCIDDVNIGDDGEDSTNEEETSNCGGEPCTDTEKEDSTLDEGEESSGDEGGDGESEDGGGEIFCLLIFISSAGGGDSGGC